MPSPVTNPAREQTTFSSDNGQPHCVVVQPAEAHWEIFSRLCHEADARGDLVPDAWFAALAIEGGM